MTRQKAAGPTQRQLRVGEELRHALAAILGRGEIHDPALADRPITVTEVRVSPDFRSAVCLVTPLGGAEAGPVLDGLARAAPYLRAQLARTVVLKRMPELRFHLDDRFDAAMRIETLLQQPAVRRDLAERGAGSDDGGAGDDDDGA